MAGQSLMTDFTTDVTVTIHGTEIDLVAVGHAICPAEPDVGIMRRWIEGWELHFADGAQIPDDLFLLMPQGVLDEVQGRA